MNKYITIIMLIGIAGFTFTVWLRPDVDVLIVFTIVSAFALQVINIIKANEATAAASAAKTISEQTKHAVNSRLDEFIRNAELVAWAGGKEEERADELLRQKKVGDIVE